MIAVFKILTGKYDINITLSFEKHQDCRTMGHSLKLVNHRCHHNLRKYYNYYNKYLEQFGKLSHLC